MRVKHLAFILVFAAAVAPGQSATPGTVTQTTVSAVTATAGGVMCVLTNTTPALPSGVHGECKSAGATVLSMDAVVAAGSNGIVGSITLGGDSVTWIVNQPDAAGPIKWQISANGAAKSGNF